MRENFCLETKKEKKERGGRITSLGTHGSCHVIPPHQDNKFTLSLRLSVKSPEVAGFPVCITLEKDRSHKGADRAKGAKGSNAPRDYRNDQWCTGNNTLGVLTERNT